MNMLEAGRTAAAQRFDTALDDAARVLSPVSNRDGIPLEIVLAGDLLSGVPGDDREAVLRSLVYAHAWDAAGVGDGLLDECADASYEVIERVAQVLYDGIVAEGNEPGALLSLAAGQIRERYESGLIVASFESGASGFQS